MNDTMYVRNRESWICTCAYVCTGHEQKCVCYSLLTLKVLMHDYVHVTVREAFKRYEEPNMNTVYFMPILHAIFLSLPSSYSIITFTRLCPNAFKYLIKRFCAGIHKHETSIIYLSSYYFILIYLDISQLRLTSTFASK